MDRVELVLEADRAVLLQTPLDARMVAFHALRKAPLARRAVEEVFPATDSADAALVAMEVLPLGPVIEKGALEAGVLSECRAAGRVRAERRDRLAGRAHATDKLVDPRSVQLVPVTGVGLGLHPLCVVAVTAPIRLVAVGAHEHSGARVVVAADCPGSGRVGLVRRVACAR